MEEPSTATRVNADCGPRLPTSLARFKQWLSEHHMTLLAIADSPHSVALGCATGIFFGFTPLVPFKTLLSIAAAWVCRCNKLAAAIAVNVHDVLIFIMPAIYFAEYKFGCRLLQRPLPVRPCGLGHFVFHDYVSWRIFSHLIWPTLLGSLFLAIPSAIIIYFSVRVLVGRGRPS